MFNNKIFISVLIIAFVTAAGAFLYFQTRQAGEFQPSDPSLSLIKQKGTLLVGSNVEYEPMEFFSDKGEIIGLDMDVAREIAKEIGINVEFKHYKWEELFPAVKSGAVDIAISSITILPERQKEMAFTNPYFNTGQVLLIRKIETGILKPEDLKSKKVGIQPDTTGKAEALKYADSENVIDYATFEIPKDNPNSGMIYDLKSGKIDVIVTDYLGAAGIVKNNPELKIAGEPFTQEYYGIATKIGNNTLVSEINQVLYKLKTTDRLKEIVNKWIIL